MTTDPDLAGFSFARRPAYPLYTKILIVVLTLVFIGGIGLAIAEPRFESTSWKLGAIGVSMLAFLGLVVLGTMTARCLRCGRTITWFGFSLDHAQAVALKLQARKDGVDIILPYARGGEPCTTVAFNGHRCLDCRIVYITGVTDPAATSPS